MDISSLQGSHTNGASSNGNGIGSGKPVATMFSLLQAAHALEGRLDTALGTVQLSMPKYSVLTVLASSGRPQTLGDLALRLRCVRSNMTQLVDRMEADGLVRRVSDATDRRVVLAEMTPLGSDRQAAGALEVDRIQSEFAAALSADDRHAIEHAVSQLR